MEYLLIRDVNDPICFSLGYEGKEDFCELVRLSADAIYDLFGKDVYERANKMKPGERRAVECSLKFV